MSDDEKNPDCARCGTPMEWGSLRRLIPIEGMTVWGITERAFHQCPKCDHKQSRLDGKGVVLTENTGVAGSA